MDLDTSPKISLQVPTPRRGEETGLRLRTMGYRVNEIGIEKFAIEKLSLQVLHPHANGSRHQLKKFCLSISPPPGKLQLTVLLLYKGDRHYCGCPTHRLIDTGHVNPSQIVFLGLRGFAEREGASSGHFAGG